MRPLEPVPEDPIRLDAPAIALSPSASERALGMTMRVVALFLILRVALLWFSILAVPVSGAIDFAGLPVEDKMLLAAFTALQAVAACGLWLLASWGPVVFILLTMLETASALGFLGTLRAPLALCIVDAGLVAIYLGLSIAAARQQRRRRI